MSKRKQTKEPAVTPYPIRSRGTGCTTDPEPNEDPMSDHSDEEGISLENLDSNSSLTIGLLKHFIEKMGKNIAADINAQIDQKVGSIKQDISEIKTEMEKSNNAFDEMHSRISSVEDKVSSIENIGEELDTIRTEWEEAITEINMEACRARKNNIIIQGVKGGSKDQQVARQNFNRVCLENLKLSQEWLDNVDIDEIYHFTPKGGEGPWPLFVRFGKTKHRDDMFRAAPNLKGSKIVLRNDLAPCLLRKKKKLIKDSDKLKAAPLNHETRFRDSPYDVWLELLKPNGKDWAKWNGLIQKDAYVKSRSS